MKLYFGNTVTTVTTLMLIALLGFIGYSVFERASIMYWGRRSTDTALTAQSAGKIRFDRLYI